MKILVLGSEGFIGSNMLQYLRSLNYKVIAADIVIKQQENYLVINPEILNFDSLFTDYEFDVCINATGAANVQFSFNYPGIDYTLNTSNVFGILDSIRRKNPGCKFVNLSSAAVYGNPESLPVRESETLKPLSPYGYHKMYSEQICAQFNKMFGIPTLSVRIFSAYGEGLKKQLFWDLYQKIKHSNGVIEMFGSGNETRDFIYIRDLVRALHCIILNAEFSGQAINVASGIESTVKEAVECFCNLFPRKVQVNFKKIAKIGDPLKWRADISVLRSCGFINEYTLNDGLNNYVNWIIKNGA
ncbi:MAG: SDR family oxidoreductase [Ferruginibacter sp.]